jgi:DNA-binding GntR family transcriptional regulator
MTHKTLRNFFIAAPMIYAAVSRLAAMNARPEAQIMRLKDTQLLFRGAIRDGDTAARALMNDRVSTRSSARWPTTNT